MRAPGEYEYTLSLSSAMVALLGHVLECRHAHQKEERRGDTVVLVVVVVVVEWRPMRERNGNGN